MCRSAKLNNRGRGRSLVHTQTEAEVKWGRGFARNYFVRAGGGGGGGGAAAVAATTEAQSAAAAAANFEMTIKPARLAFENQSKLDPLA